MDFFMTVAAERVGPDSTLRKVGILKRRFPAVRPRFRGRRAVEAKRPLRRWRLTCSRRPEGTAATHQPPLGAQHLALAGETQRKRPLPQQSYMSESQGPINLFSSLTAHARDGAL